MENYKKEFVDILNKAIEHFDPSIEDDISMITIIADVDNNKLVFGGLKLREDLEEEGESNDNSQVFYTAESKYLKDYYRTINTDCAGYEANEYYNYDKLVNHSTTLFTTMSNAIDDNEELKEKLDGLLLYGWCGVMEQMVEVDNFWSY